MKNTHGRERSDCEDTQMGVGEGQSWHNSLPQHKLRQGHMHRQPPHNGTKGEHDASDRETRIHTTGSSRAGSRDRDRRRKVNDRTHCSDRGPHTHGAMSTWPTAPVSLSSNNEAAKRQPEKITKITSTKALYTHVAQHATDDIGWNVVSLKLRDGAEAETNPPTRKTTTTTESRKPNDRAHAAN